MLLTANSSAWAVTSPSLVTEFLEDPIIEPDLSTITAAMGRSSDWPKVAISNARRISSVEESDTAELYAAL